MTKPDQTFLAPPDEVLDWRRTVLLATALRKGILENLPATAIDISESKRLDPHSVRVLLDALALWDIVIAGKSGYEPGSNFPAADEIPIINQHAQFMNRWLTELDDRMADRLVTDRAPRTPEATAAWLKALGVRARREAPGILDECLAHFPDSESILDLAGGHGEYGLEASRRGKSVTLLDMPDVIDLVAEWDSIAGAPVTLLPADVYEFQPASQFDLVLCFGFSHTQPRDRLVDLFKRLAGMITPGGGLAVNTFVRGRGPIPNLFAVQMLLAGGGGDTHSMEDYTASLTAAGFAKPTAVDLDSRTLLLARKLS